MTNDITFNTIEEMKAWVLARPDYDVRFTLNVRTRDEWDDPVTAKAWLAEPHYDYGTQEWYDYRRRKPETHFVTSYYLRGTGYYTDSVINFSVDNGLGKQVHDAWTKKSTRYGEQLTGTRSLASVLKLLGVDITKDIKVAKDAQKAEAEKRRRNSHRRMVGDRIKALMDAITESYEIGLNLPIPNFSELTSSLKEEE